VGSSWTDSGLDLVQLFLDRIATGAVPGNLESYLLLRSLRTLTLRVKRQSETAHKLATWLHSLTSFASEPSTDPEDKELVGGKLVEWVWHGSLQPRKDKDPRGREPEGANFDASKQMTGGFSPCFAIRVSRVLETCLSPLTRLLNLPLIYYTVHNRQSRRPNALRDGIFHSRNFSRRCRVAH
jgi:Cys/Met metabolism PLP-dependent enzyme